MPRAAPQLLNFNAGELSPHLEGRTDIEKYNAGCHKLENFIPMMQGPARRRPGTRFVHEVKDSSCRTWLSTFIFNVNQSYILEWGDRYVRFYTNHGILLGDGSEGGGGGGTPLLGPEWATTLGGTTVDGDLTWTNRGRVAYQNSHSYSLGDVLLDPNGNIQECTAVGTSFAGTVIAWNRVTGGVTVAGPFVRFTCRGHPAWAPLTTYADGAFVYTSVGIQEVTAGGGGKSGDYTTPTPPPPPGEESIYEVATPWACADLTDALGQFQLIFAQSADVIYITHRSKTFRPYKLSRLGTTNWTLEVLEVDGGPFEKADPDNPITVYASAETGNITLTASSAIFLSGHVEGLFYLEQVSIRDTKPWEPGRDVTLGTRNRYNGVNYECTDAGKTGTVPPTHDEGESYDGQGANRVRWAYRDPGYGTCRITSISSGTVAQAEVVTRIPSEAVGAGNATKKWAFGSWNDVFGWPSLVSFFRSRLTFGRDGHVWCSVADDFENFNNKTLLGQVTADMSISIIIPTQDAVQWFLEMAELGIGTAGTEYFAGEITSAEPLGPANIRTKPQLQHGSRAIQALRIADTIVFVQTSGKKVRTMRFNFTSDAYASSDITILAEHITGDGVQAIAFQQEPDFVLWAVRADGQLLGFTYNLEQDVTGWHRHPIGGNYYTGPHVSIEGFGTGFGKVESIAVIPSPDASQDELWMIVARRINDAIVRYVEYLTPHFETGDDITTAFYVDSGLSYSGAPATTMTGLDHLEGEYVDILADGSPQAQRQVNSGTITLDRPASTVHIGLPCPCVVTKMRLIEGSADGTAQGKKKRVIRAIFRFANTVGGKFGREDATMDRFKFRSPSDPMSHALQPFTGDTDKLQWPYGVEQEARLTYSNDQPLPCTVVAIYPEVVVSD